MGNRIAFYISVSTLCVGLLVTCSTVSYAINACWYEWIDVPCACDDSLGGIGAISVGDSLRVCTHLAPADMEELAPGWPRVDLASLAGTDLTMVMDTSVALGMLDTALYCWPGRTVDSANAWYEVGPGNLDIAPGFYEVHVRARSNVPPNLIVACTTMVEQAIDTKAPDLGLGTGSWTLSRDYNGDGIAATADSMRLYIDLRNEPFGEICQVYAISYGFPSSTDTGLSASTIWLYDESGDNRWSLDFAVEPGDLDSVGGPFTAVIHFIDNACSEDSVTVVYNGLVNNVPPSCACDCHADPAPIGACDGNRDILDVTQVINVAFRGSGEIPDPNTNCPYRATDVDCGGFTDIIDVSKMINVAFRGNSAAGEFCNPCTAPTICLIDHEGLVLMEVGDSMRRVLVYGDSLSTPRWSPDKSVIAFVDEKPLGYELRTVDSGGNSATTLLNMVWELAGNPWSPDGNILAAIDRENGLHIISPSGPSVGRILGDITEAVFLSNRELACSRTIGDDRTEIVRVGLPDTAITILVSDTDGTCYSPRASRDGSLIAYAHSTHGYFDTENEIWVMNPDGGAQRKVAGGAEGLPGGRIRALQFSDDGESIAVLADADDQTTIFVIRLGSGTVSDLNVDADDAPAMLAWSPDGQFIVFRTGVGGVAVVNVNDQSVTDISATGLGVDW